MQSLFVFLILFALAPFHQAAAEKPVPFRYPSMPADQFQTIINRYADQTALISGAGPSGLVTAATLQLTGKFKYIVIVGNRSEASRTNTVSIRPESIQQLESLGLLLALKPHLKFSEYFRFFSTESLNPIVDEFFPGNPKFIPYAHSDLSQIFHKTAWPHYSIKLADFEAAIAKHIISFKNVFLFHGTISLSEPTPKHPHRYSAQFIPDSKSSFGKTYFIAPKFIWITEGANSSTRQKLFIRMKTTEQPTEYWCSGAISLQGIAQEDMALANHITLLKKDTSGTGAFGIFRASDLDLFLNGEMTPKENLEWSAEDCLQQNAFQLLQHEQPYFSFQLPLSASDLKIVDSTAIKFAVNRRRAEKFNVAENIFFLGDAAGHGSPKGGIGLSLILSVYPELIKSFAHTLLATEDPTSIAAAIELYNQRIDKIIDYWHFGR